jgi:hypothetical protein
VTFKEKVYHEFNALLQSNVQRLQQQLAALKESTALETKSTAGDKYETARALLQSEQDVVRSKIQEALQQQVAWKQLPIDVSTPDIRKGSLVKTNRGWFFVGIALGKITLNTITVTAISTASPIGKLLIGQTINSSVVVNNNLYQVEEII